MENYFIIYCNLLNTLQWKNNYIVDINALQRENNWIVHVNMIQCKIINNGIITRKHSLEYGMRLSSGSGTKVKDIAAGFKVESKHG